MGNLLTTKPLKICLGIMFHRDVNYFHVLHHFHSYRLWINTRQCWSSLMRRTLMETNRTPSKQWLRPHSPSLIYSVLKFRLQVIIKLSSFHGSVCQCFSIHPFMVILRIRKEIHYQCILSCFMNRNSADQIFGSQDTCIFKYTSDLQLLTPPTQTPILPTP